jgi:hypothetical protein
MTTQQRIRGSCVVCYTSIPISATTLTERGVMCPLCQADQPDRRRLVTQWKKREEVLRAELARVQAALTFTPTR